MIRTTTLFVACLFIATASLIDASEPRVIAIDILVPAYANPCCDGGPSMWRHLIETARQQDRGFDLHVIFNPASGPGTQIDPSYRDAAGNGVVTDLRKAGTKVYGYVRTTFGNRPIAETKRDIDAYCTGHYAGLVDGIFFDEMSADLADVGMYRELHDYVKSISADHRTIGNPGMPYINNPSGQTKYKASDFVDAVDVLMTFESSENEYRNKYVTFKHLQNLSPQKIAHVVHSTGSWNSDLIALAAKRGAGFVYFTDDIYLDPSKDNPYDTLMSKWTESCRDLKKFNER